MAKRGRKPIRTQVRVTTEEKSSSRVLAMPGIVQGGPAGWDG